MVWYAPLAAVEDDLAAGVLARLPLSTAGSEEPIGLALRADSAPGPALNALLGAFRAEAARRRRAPAQGLPM
jgi:LysR family pca operon transcriptional activator